LIVENERKINGKTPDWSILDSSGEILAIVEMVYHHIDCTTNDSLLAQSNVEGNSYSYFPNANDPEHQRLFSQIEGKACKYRNLVTDLQIPYVIAIFIDSLAEIDTEVIKNCLMKGEKPLFNSHTGVSGVLYFEEYFCGSYRFNYIDNPFAIREMYIPSGVLEYKK
jgi:hypothetical protein